MGETECNKANSGCEATTSSGQCIMEPIIPSYRIPTKFSRCSQLYAQLWPKLEVLWPSWYDTSCALPSVKKTAVLTETNDQVDRDIDSQIVVQPRPDPVDIQDEEIEFFSLD